MATKSALPEARMYFQNRRLVRTTLLNSRDEPCPEPVCTVAEHIARHPVLVRVPSEGIRLVGETLGRCFSTASKPGMKLISSLTTALHDFHEDGICLSGFDESNLVVSVDSGESLSQIPIYKNAEPPQPPLSYFVSPDPGKLMFKRDVKFQKSTPAGIQANYSDAHAFITKNLLIQPEIPDPDDIKHLLKLMKSPESATMGSLLSSHASLVFFLLPLDMTYIPYVRHVLPRVDPAAATVVLGEIPYLDDWVERARKNKLLDLYYNHRRDKYRADANGFLDFYYDVSINMMEWSHSRWFKNGYTMDEQEMVKKVTYPELMPKIQEALWKTNHLNNCLKKYSLRS